MSEEKKVPYELRQGSRNYVRLWQGKHCLCAICTNTERGKLDAQFLLEACDGHEALLDACKMCFTVCYTNTGDFLNEKQMAQLRAAIAGSE